MKKYVAILAVFFLFSISCSAFAETCDLDGLTFEVPILFVSSDEIEGLNVYVQYFTQSFIACASTELDGMSLEENIEEVVSEMGSAITNLDKNCMVNDIPYILVELNIEGDDGGQGKAAIFVDDVKLYAIIYARMGEFTDYDLNNIESILESVHMEKDAVVPTNTTQTAEAQVKENWTVEDIQFTPPVGFIVTQNDSEALMFDDSATGSKRIRVTLEDGEGFTLETAAKMMEYSLGVEAVEYTVGAEIKGVPYDQCQEDKVILSHPSRRRSGGWSFLCKEFR